MKYLPLLLLLAVAACAEHHDLSQCKGPYLSLGPPAPPPVAATPPAPPPLAPTAAQRQTVVTK
jgi:hypothetical protein